MDMQLAALLAVHTAPGLSLPALQVLSHTCRSLKQAVDAQALLEQHALAVVPPAHPLWQSGLTVRQLLREYSSLHHALAELPSIGCVSPQ